MDEELLHCPQRHFKFAIITAPQTAANPMEMEEERKEKPGGNGKMEISTEQPDGWEFAPFPPKRNPSANPASTLTLILFPRVWLVPEIGMRLVI